MSSKVDTSKMSVVSSRGTANVLAGNVITRREGKRFLFEAGFLSNIVAFIFLFIAFCSPYWIISWPRVYSGFKRMGLWEACFAGLLLETDITNKAYHGCWWMLAPEFWNIRGWLMPGTSALGLPAPPTPPPQIKLHPLIALWATGADTGFPEPPLDIVRVTSSALQKIEKHTHSWTFTSTPPPLDIARVTSSALQKIEKHTHSWTFTSTPTPTHTHTHPWTLPCDVILIPRGGG